ncbi:hypothetical protein MKK55_25250 [Methylobacterium sp. J-059]|uniref:hypothetical protein n=1 Tax=Methylobacterium sp. J-059 TaxID=2836643 RepID=UPI001FBAB562|nr:hypothetical protein [Methylobacterium sp. J-059]MCJ2042236.1 hypothetical protein [Methylobacterium sp. J-059]
MAQRQREIEVADAEIAELDAQYVAAELQLRQVAAKRDKAKLRKRLLETLLSIENDQEVEQEQVTQMLEGLISQRVKKMPTFSGVAPYAPLPEGRSLHLADPIVDRHKLDEMMGSIKPNRHQVCHMIVDLLENSYPEGQGTAEIDKPILKTGIVKESVLAKCKSILREKGVIKFDRKSGSWLLDL